jgi:CHAD domain-containing protein
MTRQDIIHTLKSRFESIQAAFDIAIDYLDAKDIHTFRVEVKKLRAFLHLAPSGVKGKLPRRLHQFYRMVGGIRNLQLQEQRIRDAFLNQSGLPETYLNLLAIEAATAIRRARRFAAHRLSITSEERQLLTTLTHLAKDNPQGFARDNPQGFARDNSQGFAENTLTRLQTLSDNHHPIDDDDLHSLRKCLKDLLYNHSYIEKEGACILSSILSDGKEGVSELTDLLGQFQDLRSGLVLLQPNYIDQIIDAGEKKMLEEVREVWERDKAAIKDQVLSTILPILHPPAGGFSPVPRRLQFEQLGIPATSLQ